MIDLKKYGALFSVGASAGLAIIHTDSLGWLFTCGAIFGGCLHGYLAGFKIKSALTALAGALLFVALTGTQIDAKIFVTTSFVMIGIMYHSINSDLKKIKK